jgi:hypothetical protein
MKSLYLEAQQTTLRRLISWVSLENLAIVIPVKHMNQVKMMQETLIIFHKLGMIALIVAILAVVVMEMELMLSIQP